MCKLNAPFARQSLPTANAPRKLCFGNENEQFNKQLAIKIADMLTKWVSAFYQTLTQSRLLSVPDYNRVAPDESCRFFSYQVLTHSQYDRVVDLTWTGPRPNLVQDLDDRSNLNAW